MRLAIEFVRYTPGNFANALNYAAMLRAWRLRWARENDQVFEVPDSFRSVVSFEMPTVKTFSPACDSPEFKFISRMFTKAYEVLLHNEEVLYTRMSVMTALQILAVSNIITKHGPNARAIKQQDTEERKIYTNQGVDPNYKPEPIVFVKNDLLFQPHQAKVDNVTRGSPKCLAYPVAAGGGKTILIMTNIFREMKAGVCKRPIVVCPPTLVSQYVEECVFVTEGRVNVIPLTNATMRMHGEERLKKMIENAPINTIVVTDMDFIKGRAQDVAYGNKTVVVWTNAEFLRQFEFDLVAIDESHKIKNLKSSRREATARFMQDIPYKRIASGTLVDNTIVDLVSQIALFDPTIFGSAEKFRNDYASKTSGERVLAWNPGAEKEIRAKISEHVVMAVANRKEWSALLPPSEERFHAVELSENQRLLYESILKETTDLIEEAMSKNSELKEALESEDESVVEDLESMLRPYLTRLEKYLSSPETDEAAPLFLKNDEDKISPKVRKIYQICKEHLEAGYPGKILIFTNFRDSALAVFKFAPPELKKMMIHYTAENKMEARSQLANREDKRIMVGSSGSMDTGLNFQMVSRLIRMETIWTPGLLEQGNSRINRPQLKKAETRSAVYFDWLMVNRTIDVTKIARLISKIVSKAKFDEFDSEEYQKIESLPVIAMKISTIAEMNDFREELLPYLQTYEQYKQVQTEDYRNYREENEGKLDAIPVVPGGLLANSKLMSRVPYIPGMTLYATDQLGLVRYDEFLHKDLSALEADDDEAEDAGTKDEDTNPDNPRAAEIRAMQARWNSERLIVLGMPCHTEFGDGTIYGVRKKVWVEFNNTGERMRVPKLQVFLITRTTTNSKDMRNELLKAVGKIPLDSPIEVPVEKGVETQKKIEKVKQVVKPTKVVDESIHASFNLAVINDIVTITFDGSGNDRAVSAVQNFGFKLSPHFVFTRIRGPIIMLALFKKLKEKGFKITPKESSHLKNIYMALKGNRTAMNNTGFATQMQIQMLTREQIKPSADPFQLKIYPLVENGLLYMLMPTKGQTANIRAKAITVTGVRWVMGGGEAELRRFCKNKAEVQVILKEIKASGVVIDNIKELEQQWKALKSGAKRV